MRTVFENEGDIRGVDLLACLVALWRENASGSLQFSRSGATAGFELVNGEIVASSASDPRFETAAILVRAGKLDTATLERLAAPEGGDRALLALQAGVLTRREWRWGEKIRAVEILSDLIAWLDGEYWFFRTTEREAPESRLPIPRLILELFLRSRDRSLVLHYMGGVDVPLARAETFDEEFATFGLTADAESVVRLIDGTSTAAEISSEAPAEAFAVEKLLAALVTLGLIHPEFGAGGSAVSRARDAAPPPAPVPAAEPVDEPGPAGEEAEAAGDDGEREEPESQEGGPAELDAPEDADAEAQDEGPRILDEDAPPAGPEDAAMTDAPLHGGPSPEPELDASGADRDEEPYAGLEGFDAGGRQSEPAFERPLDTTTGIGGFERPEQRSVSPFIWVLGVLAVAVAAVMFFRSRVTTSTPEPPPSATPAPLETTTVAGVPPAEATPAVAVLTAAPTAPAPAPTAAPVATRPPTAAPVATARPVRGKTPAPAPAVPAVAAAAPESGPQTSRQYWLDRAARDQKRFAGSKKSRYAIQLELACEVGSLVDAFRHDRPAGSMWVLATPYQGKTCFRVLWGHYATPEAAHRALSGAPGFFSTQANHPAVTGIR